MIKRRVNVRGVVLRDGKILAVKHKNEKGEEADYWATPGGGLESMESFADCIEREFFEELGIKVKPGKLLFVQQFVSDRDEWEEELELFFQVEDSSEFDHVDLTKTSHGALELSRVEFVDPKNLYILPSFLSEVDVKAYTDGKNSPYIHDRLTGVKQA